MTSSAMTSPELDPLRTAISIVRLTRLLDQRLRAYARDDGLGMAELGVMAEIGRDTTLPSAIARVTFLDPARVTRIVDRLVSLGLVTREVSRHDRRQCPLALTAQGQERLDQGRLDTRAIMAGLLDGLTDDERDALALALNAVQRILAAPQG